MATRFSRPRLVDVVTQTVLMNAPKPSDIAQAKLAIREMISALPPADRIAALTALLAELPQAVSPGASQAASSPSVAAGASVGGLSVSIRK